jgi:hypothetical protein
MLDRRQEQRAISMFKTAYVRSGGDYFFVTLRNISESGLCFDAFPGVAVGAEIEFCFDSAEPRAGVVRWVRDGRFGVQVPDGNLLAAVQPRIRPRAVRLPLALRARLYIDGERTEVAVHNLSLRGTCIDHVAGMRIGQLVSLEVGGRCFASASIRWFNNEKAGICFAEPIALHEFREFVEKLQDIPLRSLHYEQEAGQEIRKTLK